MKAHVETISSRHQGVTLKVIGHFEKCFTYAVKQNEGKPADVKKALLNVVPHRPTSTIKVVESGAVIQEIPSITNMQPYRLVEI